MWRLLRPDALAIFQDEGIKKSLMRYAGIVEAKIPAKFLVARKLATDFDQDDSTARLWELHYEATTAYYELEGQIDSGAVQIRDLPDCGKSYLDLKVELGRRIMEDCHFCERHCHVDRLRGQKGYCRCGAEISVSTIFPHTGEEPELVPSGTVFSCGCTIRCVHCQNWTISQWMEGGEKYDSRRLASCIEELHRTGCRNVNMVGGEPTPYAWSWLKTMQSVRANIATVWNSNSYYSQETAQLLAGFIDVYLLDFKYGNNDCAERISQAQHYLENCTRNHLSARKNGELIIRVLVLPEHNACCTRPVLQWIAKNLGPWTRVNLMFQYRPDFKANEVKELQRVLTREEKEEALAIAREAGLRNLVK